ncbi:MAG: 6-carboxytetrahydropterin synthase [Phycisphaerales bacterium]|nr:6-carboxytetrahydropterin synthase [Phycisphaerales bacterium]
MHTLTRTVRFAVGPSADARGVNGFAGNPSVAGFDRHYELRVSCRGEVDAVTGYLIDIKAIDRAVRDRVVPLFVAGVEDGETPASVLRQSVGALASLPAALQSVRLFLTPYHSLEMAAADQTTVVMRQRFDFSAAHRLHSPSLSDEENRRLYGKCNNPRGHGHNYVVEPAVRCKPDALPLAELEALTDRVIIQAFDHKHLNEDTVEFDVRKGGVLPSVENIARVFFDRLAPELAKHSSGAVLERITVWETDRTCASYPG